MGMRSKLLVTLAGLTAVALPGAVNAQIIEPLMPIPPLPPGPEAPPAPGAEVVPIPGEPGVVGHTVTDRPRPEYDPLGVRFGNWFFFPRAEVDESYNDNIFATASNRQSAWITTLMPSFDLLSNYATGGVRVSGGAALGRYAGHSSENFDDAYGSLSGHYDVDALHTILGGLDFDRLHEPRTSPSSPGNAAEPVKYSTYSANVGFAQTGTRIGYRADGIVTRSEFEAPPAVGGGFVPQDDRNETGYEGALRLSYEFVPDVEAYVRGSGNSQNFDHAAGNGIAIRNSNGYRIDAGLRADLTGVTYADAYVGYLKQYFEASQYGTIGGVDYGADVVWNFTTLDTFKLGATRAVENANAEVVGIATSPGYLASIETASLDHELLRNVLLNVHASYETDDWKGINRTDHIPGVGAGVKYLLNRNLYLGLNYDYSRRLSSGTGQTTPYTQNIFLLRLSTQI